MNSQKEFGIRGGFSAHLNDLWERHQDRDYGFNGIFTEENGQITGVITDNIGDAAISGTLTQDALEFTKSYLEKPDREPIIYNYQLTGEVYQGTYHGDDVDSRSTYCRILEGATPALLPNDIAEHEMKQTGWYSLP